MKKLLLLLLVFTGYVCGASAQITESGTMKVYIQNKLVSSWDEIILRHWGYDNSRVAADVNETGTEVIDGITWHVYELSIEYANNAPFLVYNGSWGTTNQSSNYDSDGSVYGDTFFDLKQDNSSSQPYLERQTRFYMYNTSTHLSIKMNTSDFSTYTLSLDNTDGSLTGYYAIAANYAFKDKGTGEINDWNTNTFRPQDSGNLTLGFETYTSQSAPRTSYGGTWYISAKAIHDFTFVPNSWSDATWSVSPYFTRTLPAGAEGYGTFSSEYDVIPDAGLTAQYASAVNTTTGKITWTDYAATGIKAEQGALLYGTAGTEYRFTPATSAETPATNYLAAATSAKADFTGDDGYNCYILTKQTVDSDNAALCFYKVNSTTGNNIGAGTAYLKIPQGGSAREFFALDNETTGINTVKGSESLVNGSDFFDLQGRKVAQPTKGLYIVNGKKVIVK